MDMEEKILIFVTALTDVYKDEDEREADFLPKLDLKEETITEDFTCMIYALMVIYKRITNDNMDALGFTHLCNRLIFQQILEDKGVEL